MLAVYTNKKTATHMTKEQERKEEGQASPHPGLKTLWASGEKRKESLNWENISLTQEKKGNIADIKSETKNSDMYAYIHFPYINTNIFVQQSSK